MRLATGTTLGPYEVLAAIGAGGMGEVYKARDTKLDRDVALKILPDAFVNDPERLARFQREAKVLASLNHPNIAQIYGLEESGDSPALVLEYVEGPTLQDRIANGPIPLDEALPIARQIAEALEAAHEQGIIHRDLKPANVKVKDDGTVKVLDFGLAKALGPDLSDLDAANSPTMTMTAAATKMGVIMGTAAYMSPEQAAGKPADRRSDNWSFGVVLWEMLTGRQLFTGESISHVLASVLKTDPDWNELPANTPLSVRRLLRRCLERTPKKRLPDAAMARLEIDEADAASGSSATEPTAPVAPPAIWQRPIAVVGLALVTLALGAFGAWFQGSASSPAAPVTRTSIVLPPSQTTGRTSIGISPLGTHVAYISNRQLYVRALNEFEAQPLASANNSLSPFFSPDGQWIGFYSLQEGALKKVALSGGGEVTLTQAGITSGASWGDDDTIVFGQWQGGIRRVSGAGGPSEELVTDTWAGNPQLLPGGETLLFVLAEGPFDWGTSQIVVERLATGERTVLIEEGYSPRYLETGHLLYGLGDSLMAVPFDVERLEVTGGPVPMVEGVNRAEFAGAAVVDVARNGTLVYQPFQAGARVRTLMWVGRDGTEERLPVPARYFIYARLSPDGTRVVLDARDEENDIWIWHLERETLTRLTFGAGYDGFPVWTPDGQRVVFASGVTGENANLFWRAADGTGTLEQLTDSPNRQVPSSVSPDGTRLVFWEYPRGVEGGDVGDLMTLTLDAERRIEPLIADESAVLNAEISPDGRWMAYQSDRSGSHEIYVQPFPEIDGGMWQVSTAGGLRPLWGPDGQELFYQTSAGVMGVTIEPGTTFMPGTPELVVPGPYYGSAAGGSGRTYDISLDGQRFLLMKEGAIDADDPFAGLTRFHVVQNWTQELLERVPVP